jgi:hypothetical protein
MLNRPLHSFNGFQGVSRRGQVAFKHKEGLGSSVPLLGVGIGAPQFRFEDGWPKTNDLDFRGIGNFWDRVTPWDTGAEKKRKRRAAERKRKAEEKAFQEALKDLQSGGQTPPKANPMVLLALVLAGGVIIYGLRK